MTIVSGKIEPLKRLKETLHDHGIYRFSSVGEISIFLKEYNAEKNEIPVTVKSTLDEEIHNLNEAMAQAIDKRDKNAFYKVFYYLKTRRLIKKHTGLVNNYEDEISKRCMESYHELESIKETVEGLYSLIAGAIGENSVVSELQKLSDNYYLINDFSLKFDTPIFNKRENDRIYSIQIDHLLVCQSGVFVLETKNWSARSIDSLDLRSPVEQIKRASYALFVFLNSDSNLGLTRHHWGSKKIPIRNIIVMTNKAPKGDFQYVKVLTLNELNGYIKDFDEIFDETEVKNIFEYLNSEVQ